MPAKLPISAHPSHPNAEETRFVCGPRRPAFTKAELWIFVAGYSLGVVLTTVVFLLILKCPS